MRVFPIEEVGSCDEKNLPWFVVGYDFYPTRCMFSIEKSFSIQS